MNGLTKLRQSLDSCPPSIKEAEQLLDALRWKEDMLVTNDFGERVWLGPCIHNGKKIGITDCCFEDNPCSKHKEKK